MNSDRASTPAVHDGPSKGPQVIVALALSALIAEAVLIVVVAWSMTPDGWKRNLPKPPMGNVHSPDTVPRGIPQTQPQTRHQPVLEPHEMSFAAKLLWEHFDETTRLVAIELQITSQPPAPLTRFEFDLKWPRTVTVTDVDVLGMPEAWRLTPEGVRVSVEAADTPLRLTTEVPLRVRIVWRVPLADTEEWRFFSAVPLVLQPTLAVPGHIRQRSTLIWMVDVKQARVQ